MAKNTYAIDVTFTSTDFLYVRADSEEEARKLARVLIDENEAVYASTLPDQGESDITDVNLIPAAHLDAHEFANADANEEAAASDYIQGVLEAA